MTDNDVLPLDGGETPDDPALKTRVAAAYLNTPSPDESAVARCVRYVLERVTAEHAVPVVARPAASVVRSRRWVFGAAAIAAVLLLSITFRNRTPSSLPESGEGASAAAVATTTAVPGGVQFGLRLPKDQAANVSVIGDFNGWDSKATPMVRDAKSGEWSAKIVLLPGRHIYAYLVNGEKWIVDPMKPQVPDAGYGPANALVVEEDSK